MELLAKGPTGWDRSCYRPRYNWYFWGFDMGALVEVKSTSTEGIPEQEMKKGGG
jgi:hypothetical protein